LNDKLLILIISILAGKMANITLWLDKFKNSWIKKDIKSILELFSDDVEYYETPSKMLKNKAEIEKQWAEIKNQNNIKLKFKTFSQQDNKYAVIWNLKFYSDKDNEYQGIYLISLNSENKCDYFLQA
jgi:hypothetical protein